MPLENKNNQDFSLFMDILVNGDGIKYSELLNLIKSLPNMEMGPPMSAEELFKELNIMDEKKSEIKNKIIPTLFRAIPTSRFIEEKKHKIYKTLRIPGNIPYVVDNILEWLRPINMPNRRLSAYANLTTENALKNASTDLSSDERYMVCRLEIHDSNIKIAQLNVPDARYHPDIKKLQKVAINHFNKIIQNSNTLKKYEISPIFMPCLTKQEMDQVCKISKEVDQLLQECKIQSTFWKDAEFKENSNLSDGELFFELSDFEAYYKLIPIK